MLRGVTDLPIACGFGISSPEAVRAVVGEGGADAAIVGSALVRVMTEASDAGGDAVGAAAGFVRELAGGLSG
jgi:tryptophan synthase alpha chain